MLLLRFVWEQKGSRNMRSTIRKQNYSLESTKHSSQELNEAASYDQLETTYTLGNLRNLSTIPPPPPNGSAEKKRFRDTSGLADIRDLASALASKGKQKTDTDEFSSLDVGSHPSLPTAHHPGMHPTTKIGIATGIVALLTLFVVLSTAAIF